MRSNRRKGGVTYRCVVEGLVGRGLLQVAFREVAHAGHSCCDCMFFLIEEEMRCDEGCFGNFDSFAGNSEVETNKLRFRYKSGTGFIV